MSEEIWKPVVGYEGRYEVSNQGRLRNRRGKCIGRLTSYGYIRAALSNGAGPRWYMVHRLVLEAFVGPCPHGMEACHGNGVRSDNALTNLRWDTTKGNFADREAHGTTARGERCGKAKLTEADVRLALSLRGSLSANEIAKRLGVVSRTVRDIFRGATWRHVK